MWSGVVSLACSRASAGSRPDSRCIAGGTAPDRQEGRHGPRLARALRQGSGQERWARQHRLSSKSVPGHTAHLARSGRRRRVALAARAWSPRAAAPPCRSAGARVRGSGTLFGGAQATQQRIKVSPGEAPGEGDRGLLIAALELASGHRPGSSPVPGMRLSSGRSWRTMRRTSACATSGSLPASSR
jgi:hypothetical protein